MVKILLKSKGTGNLSEGKLLDECSVICENRHFCKVHASGEEVLIVCHECKESVRLNNMSVVRD